MEELAGVRVLVVDDERDTRDVLEMLLRAHGAETRGMGSAAEGLACLRAFHPHVLVSDLAMPGEDGLVFIQRVRGLPRAEGGAVPSLALSAHVYNEDRERALAAGFDAFITKPVPPGALVACILALLARAGAERRQGERRRGGHALERAERRRWQRRRQLQTC
jgi:CheY-like chemotaxis protein